MSDMRHQRKRDSESNHLQRRYDASALDSCDIHRSGFDSGYNQLDRNKRDRQWTDEWTMRASGSRRIVG